MYFRKVINNLNKFIIIIIFVIIVNLFFISYVGLNINKFNLSMNKNNFESIIEFYKKIFFKTNYQNVKDKKLSFTQEKYYTCGPAAVKYILYYYGITASESELEKLMNTTEEGSSLYAMKNTINRYGLNSNGLLVNYSRLCEIRMPVVAFVKNDHYIVIKRVTDKYIYIFDPNPEYAYLKLSRENFLNVWDGVILKVNAKSNE